MLECKGYEPCYTIRRECAQGNHKSMFVDGLLEVGTVASADREAIEASFGDNSPDVSAVLDKIGSTQRVPTGSCVA